MELSRRPGPSVRVLASVTGTSPQSNIQKMGVGLEVENWNKKRETGQAQAQPPPALGTEGTANSSQRRQPWCLQGK